MQEKYPHQPEIKVVVQKKDEKVKALMGKGGPDLLQ